MEENTTKMIDGYFVKSTGSLKIKATNIKEFEALIGQAEEEARQLNNTLQKLSAFDLNIDFETTEPTLKS